MHPPMATSPWRRRRSAVRPGRPLRPKPPDGRPGRPMEGARTRGQAAALAAVAAMVRGPAPQAVLFVGPDGVGKTTLALDLAAGLLCTAAPEARPCRQCRACRLVEHGTHPDMHLLSPAGPGRQVVIGGPDAKYRGVKDLIGDLLLM